MDLDLKQTNKLIGENFKRLRRAHKLTQEEIAEKCNVTPEYLSKFENGKYNASIYNIILFCQAIHASPMQLLHPFFELSNDNISELLLAEFKGLKENDQNLILEIVKRFNTNKK